jgi:hypothetical protein
MDDFAFDRTGYQADAARDVRARTGLAYGQVLAFQFKGELAYERDGAADAKRAFSRLAKKWRQDTRHLSSPSDRYLHPSAPSLTVGSQP